jgi:hypothetical protein
VFLAFRGKRGSFLKAFMKTDSCRHPVAEIVATSNVKAVFVNRKTFGCSIDLARVQSRYRRATSKSDSGRNASNIGHIRSKLLELHERSGVNNNAGIIVTVPCTRSDTRTRR